MTVNQEFAIREVLIVRRGVQNCKRLILTRAGTVSVCAQLVATWRIWRWSSWANVHCRKGQRFEFRICRSLWPADVIWTRSWRLHMKHVCSNPTTAVDSPTWQSSVCRSILSVEMMYSVGTIHELLILPWHKCFPHCADSIVSLLNHFLWVLICFHVVSFGKSTNIICGKELPQKIFLIGPTSLVCVHLTHSSLSIRQIKPDEPHLIFRWWACLRSGILKIAI